MLAEWIKSLRVPAPDHVKRMGYVRELVAIEARQRRCSEAWAPHQAETRAIVEEAVALCPGRERAVVLGSGLLLDIPLARLVERFAEVVLVDIAHLPSTRAAVAPFETVTLLEADLSGVARPVDVLVAAERQGYGPLPLPEPHPSPPVPPETVDLVVSVNLLTQLPATPVAWIERRLGARHGFDEARLADYREAILRAHLELLREFGGVTCLVTEVESLYRDRGGALLEREPLLPDGLLPVVPEAARRDWEWALAPPGEIDRRYGLHRRVIGIPSLWAPAPRVVEPDGGGAVG